MNMYMAEIIAEISPMIDSIILALLFGLASWLGIKVDAYMQSLEDNEKMKKIRQALETNKELVQISVDYVEQVGQHLLSEEKKALAIKKATELANQWGVTISEVELETMIEQLVLGFNDGYDNRKDAPEAELPDDMADSYVSLYDVEDRVEVINELDEMLIELRSMTKGGKE